MLTEEFARASGWDAGNRSMRAACRSAWNIDDRNVATQETLRLLLAGGFMTREMADRCGYEGATHG